MKDKIQRAIEIDDMRFDLGEYGQVAKNVLCECVERGDKENIKNFANKITEFMERHEIDCDSWKGVLSCL